MNKISRISAACALVAAAPFAAAQSTVQLSGVVDLAVRHASNSVGSVTSLASGGNSTSRLQFTGTEDLGGGLRAGFWLEGTINADTGNGATASGLTFDRRSTVSLMHDSVGELRLGRDWTPVFLGQVYTDPFFALGVGSFGNFLNASVNTVFRRAFGSALQPTVLSRTSNSIGYYLPANAWGFYGHLQAGLSENVHNGASGNPAGNFRTNGARIGYRIAGVDVALFGNDTHIDAQHASLKQEGVSAAYTFTGGARISSSYTRSRFLESKQDLFLIGATVPIQQFLLKAAYYRLNQKGYNERAVSIDRNDAQQFSLGVDYYLSKRTAIYTDASLLRNRGAATFTVAGAPSGSALGQGIVGGTRGRGYEVGLRHSV